MSWLHQWRMRRAAKQYARKLGPHLARAYGAAEHYTVAQVRTSVARLGLKPDFIALGLAGFCAEENYAAIAAQLPIPMPYDEARARIARFRSSRRFGASDYYESGLGMTGGLDSNSS